MSNIDPRFKGQIFRKSHPMIIAANRQLASILPVRLAYDAGGYSAGQVLAKNTTSSQYQDYNNSGASGTDTAAAILLEDVDVTEFEATSGTVMAAALFGGEAAYDKLIGIDAPAIVDLNGRRISDSSGLGDILKF